MRRDGNLFDPQMLHPLFEDLAIDPIVIANEVLGRRLKRKRLRDLPRRPQGRRLLRDIEMDHSPTIRRQHQKAVQQSERRRRHHEEVDCRDHRQVILPERFPARRSRPSRLPRQILCKRLQNRIFKIPREIVMLSLTAG